jgi:hypothetical protein
MVSLLPINPNSEPNLKVSKKIFISENSIVELVSISIKIVSENSYII